MVSALTLSRLFDGFILAKQAAGVRDTTLETYRVMYHSLIASLPTECLADVRRIEPQYLTAWAAGLRDYAAATRDQRIAKAKALFHWAADSGYIDASPAASLKRPRKDWQPDPLTGDEITRLLKEARQGRQGERNYAIVCLFLDSGIRNSELCGLKRGDVSLKTGQLVVTGKGGKTRTVMVGKRTKEALWRWMVIQNEEIPWLFATENGRKFRYQVMSRLVARIGKRAGIANAGPHRLRHTFALLYLKNRGDPYSLQYLLGHEDMTVTREYVKIAAQDAREMYRSPLDQLDI